ncbi:right-handed parallel beta-helix repeat-containing protein [Humitalea sp. 24SJ18S-53]|uniref:right-handed parallel beta-helix repeat-containing protein n=1 Tax=Humitalea sp. 24SJ18S-53 TaxID=3422307 RepID=UPI003D668551
MMKISRRGLQVMALALPALTLARHAQAAVIDVGTGGRYASLATVPWATLRPGDEVVLRAGTYSLPTVITARGTAAQPIVVRALPGAIIRESIVFDGAQHVRLDSLFIERTRHSGVIIRRASSFITVAGCTIQNCGLGIWIGDGAGGGHRLIDNTLQDTQTHGIAVDVVNAPLGQETLIAGNRVARNAMHGMEINGNRYIVEGNIVWDNGHGLSGTSGIHTYSKDAAQASGSDNIIRYNIVWGQKETTGQDGNGIQLDQWCDRNQVYFNICFGNDGAGIVLFDAAECRVDNNTLFDNMRDSGGQHAYKADLVLASDFTKNVNHTYDNVLRNNLVVTLRRNIASVYVDPFASSRTREMAGNMFHHAGGGTTFVWNATRLANLAAWNAAKPGRPDLSADPRFVDPQRLALAPPEATGLRPRLAATRSGLALADMPPTRDLLGAALTALPIGALLPDA